MQTHIIPLAWLTNTDQPLTLIRFRILTGRKHQIRIQSSRRGYPLLGDSRYGSPIKNGTYYLHASCLVFPSNRLENLPERVYAPLPARFNSFMELTFGPDVLAQIERGELY